MENASVMYNGYNHNTKIGKQLNTMKKQLIFIHGGDSYSEYGSFLNHLRTGELRNVLEDPPKRWKNTLRDELRRIYDVYMPSMPNSDNANILNGKFGLNDTLH